MGSLDRRVYDGLMASLRTGRLASLVLCLAGCSPATTAPDASPGTDSGPSTSVEAGPRGEAGGAADQGAGDSRDPRPLPDGPPWPNSYTPPNEQHVLDGLRAGHPRLILTDADLHAVKARLADPVVKGYFDALKKSADALLSAPVEEHVLESEMQILLYVSRRVLNRLYTLSLLYRLTGQKTYRDRAVAEMKAVAAFSDWHPTHFLGAAEMTHAMAIGYDWLHGTLSAEERKLFEGAILQKGLLPGKAYFEGTAGPDIGADWTTSPTNKTNWALVCNGSLAIGGLAVADVYPTTVRQLLTRNVTAMPTALASYAPDGGWPEGPMYWSYGTRYAINAFAALRSALGHDFGLSTLAGISATGEYRTHVVGPSGLLFNYGDSIETPDDEPSLFWLAGRFDKPLLAWAGRSAAGTSGSPADLFWYDSRGSVNDLASVGTERWFKGINIMTFRSAWSPTAIYLGLKAGSNTAGHAHLDLGSFVFEANGERWALDLGPDTYSDAYFSSAHRWTEYYRTQTQGHNTLLIKNANSYRNQNHQASAPIVLARSYTDQAYAIADLSAAYLTNHLVTTKVRRGVALLPGRDRVLIQDEVDLGVAEEVYWAMHTDAKVTLQGARATLSKNGHSVLVQMVQPGNASFAVEAIPASLIKKPLPAGMVRLAARLPSTTKSVRFVILLLPSGQPAASLQVHPLSDWATKGPGQ